MALCIEDYIYDTMSLLTEDCIVNRPWNFFSYKGLITPIPDKLFIKNCCKLSFMWKKRNTILTWHLLGHAIKSVTCFDLQFSRNTRPMTSFCTFIAHINTLGGNSFQRQNYKMRLKQRSLNWINSMQVKKILFTNVIFSWSLCLLNMFPSMVFPKHLYFPGKIGHFLENGGIWMINHHIFKVF